MSEALKRGNRGVGFDRDCEFYADLLRQCQAHIATVRGVVALLNSERILSPYGGRWSYGLVYRMLRRAAELGLTAAPQTKHDAARARYRRRHVAALTLCGRWDRF
jgi:hypothetical protein